MNRSRQGDYDESGGEGSGRSKSRLGINYGADKIVEIVKSVNIQDSHVIAYFYILRVSWI